MVCSQSTYKLFIYLSVGHPSINASIYSFIYPSPFFPYPSFIHPFIFILLYICSVHSFYHKSYHQFVGTSIHLFLYPPTHLSSVPVSFSLFLFQYTHWSRHHSQFLVLCGSRFLAWAQDLDKWEGFVFQSLCEHILSCLLVKYLGVEWLDHTVDIGLIYKKLLKFFSINFYSFTFLPVPTHLSQLFAWLYF